MFVQILFLSWLLALLDMWKAGGILVWPLSLLRKSKKSENVIKVEQAEELGNTKVNEDVKREKEKVRNCTEAHETEKSVLVKDLQKDFGKKRVVNDLSFLVEHGEIFGLLGPNGAGKTTTLNMITADFKPTKGQIYVAGHNISTDLDDAFQNLGYCPQHDALWELVTLKEHLKCYALLKGVPKNRVDTLVRHFMVALRITEHANKKAKDLSGGTKRKLSFLMSAVGSPGTMMMDEPSTGMDPAAKRFLWTVISNNITDNRGAILTTHSMEEADALCHRVGIIVKGQLRCIGTTQELKTNYGGGYHLEIKAKSGGEESLDDKMAKIKNFVLGIFPDAVEDELFGNRVIFKVPQETVGHLSNVFASFERGKQTLDIEEYSFSQSTLEHVFLEFAKEQDDELTGKVNGSYTQQEPSVTL